jgi:predicted metal-dependent peptidase
MAYPMQMAKDTANTKDINLPVGFETDEEEDYQAREKLTTARVNMLLKAGWFGTMATRLPLVNADAWLPTAATDGKYFYYNSKFILMLRPLEIVFLFGHEVLHNVYDHLGRSKDNKHNPQLANIAADYCVNRDLKLNNIGEMITTVPALYDPKYDGWSFEEVYDYLFENAEKIDIDDLVDQLLDEHLDGDEGQGSGSGEQPQEDSKGNLVSKSKPKYSKEEKKRIRDEIKEAVLQSAQTSGAGQTPAGVQRIIKDLTEPKMDWRELLSQTIESTIKSDYSFMRPNKKSFYSEVLMPGMIPENTIDVAIAIDMSGSITDVMAGEMLSEVKGIMNMYTDFNIQLWCFDTKTYAYKKFDVSNLDEIDTYKAVGGGGTDFDCNWTFMKENDIQPSKFIMFTDGYPWDSWGDPDYCDTVFIIHGNDNIVPPFGTHAYYQFKKEKRAA